MKASEHIYSDLRRRLMTGYYAPRTQLKEHDLAAEYAVSRTPVRVALSLLVSEKLLTAESNRGVFVAEWTACDVAEVFGLRRMLEGHAAGLAAQRHTPEHLVELSSINTRMADAAAAYRKDASAVAIIQSTNNAFHRCVLGASSSPRLIGMCSSLVDTPMIIGSFYLYNQEEIALSIQQHESIVAAVKTRSYAYASEAMSLHLRSAFEVYSSRRSATS